MWSGVQTSGTAPSARAGHGFSALGSKIFVHGGNIHRDGINLVNDMYQFATDTNVWQQVDSGDPPGDPPTGRYFHGFGSVDDLLLVHGGLAQDLSWVDARVIKYGPSMECIETCVPGTFKLLTSTGSLSDLCLSCPAGKFSAEFGSRKCDTCPAGVDSAIASASCT